MIYFYSSVHLSISIISLSSSSSSPISSSLTAYLISPVLTLPHLSIPSPFYTSIRPLSQTQTFFCPVCLWSCWICLTSTRVGTQPFILPVSKAMKNVLWPSWRSVMMTSFMSPILQGKRKTLISHKMSTESVLAECILFCMILFVGMRCEYHANFL